eukprot:CFRG5526T1
METMTENPLSTHQTSEWTQATWSSVPTAPGLIRNNNDQASLENQLRSLDEPLRQVCEHMGVRPSSCASQAASMNAAAFMSSTYGRGMNRLTKEHAKKLAGAALYTAIAVSKAPGESIYASVTDGFEKLTVRGKKAIVSNPGTSTQHQSENRSRESNSKRRKSGSKPKAVVTSAQSVPAGRYRGLMLTRLVKFCGMGIDEFFGTTLTFISEMRADVIAEGEKTELLEVLDILQGNTHSIMDVYQSFRHTMYTVMPSIPEDSHEHRFTWDLFCVFKSRCLNPDMRHDRAQLHSLMYCAVVFTAAHIDGKYTVAGCGFSSQRHCSIGSEENDESNHDSALIADYSRTCDECGIARTICVLKVICEREGIYKKAKSDFLHLFLPLVYDFWVSDEWVLDYGFNHDIDYGKQDMCLSGVINTYVRENRRILLTLMMRENKGAAYFNNDFYHNSKIGNIVFSRSISAQTTEPTTVVRQDVGADLCLAIVHTGLTVRACLSPIDEKYVHMLLSECKVDLWFEKLHTKCRRELRAVLEYSAPRCDARRVLDAVMKTATQFCLWGCMALTTKDDLLGTSYKASLGNSTATLTKADQSDPFLSDNPSTPTHPCTHTCTTSHEPTHVRKVNEDDSQEARLRKLMLANKDFHAALLVCIILILLRPIVKAGIVLRNGKETVGELSSMGVDRGAGQANSDSPHIDSNSTVEEALVIWLVSTLQVPVWSVVKVIEPLMRHHACFAESHILALRSLEELMIAKVAWANTEKSEPANTSVSVTRKVYNLALRRITTILDHVDIQTGLSSSATTKSTRIHRNMQLQTNTEVNSTSEKSKTALGSTIVEGEERIKWFRTVAFRVLEHALVFSRPCVILGRDLDTLVVCSVYAAMCVHALVHRMEGSAYTTVADKTFLKLWEDYQKVHSVVSETPRSSVIGNDHQRRMTSFYNDTFMPLVKPFIVTCVESSHIDVQPLPANISGLGRLGLDKYTMSVSHGSANVPSKHWRVVSHPIPLHVTRRNSHNATPSVPPHVVKTRKKVKSNSNYSAQSRGSKQQPQCVIHSSGLSLSSSATPSATPISSLLVGGAQRMHTTSEPRTSIGRKRLSSSASDYAYSAGPGMGKVEYTNRWHAYMPPGPSVESSENAKGQASSTLEKESEADTKKIYQLA